MHRSTLLMCLVAVGCSSGDAAPEDVATDARIDAGASGSGGKAGAGRDAASAGGSAGKGTGGTSSGGSAGNGTGGAVTVDAAPHTVLPCDALANAGQWEQITPKEVSLDPSFKTPAGDNFGVHAFVVDPTNTANVYVGTSAQGIYKSTDCGATWAHINTGRNGDKLDSGRQWTFVIDPVDPKVLYTNAGYGQNNAFKSTNGGVDWDVLIDSESVKALQFGGFVHIINMDPTDHQHLIVSPHFACEVGAVNGLPKTPNCLLETRDAGATWAIVESESMPGGMEGGGQWMAGADTWYWAHSYDGLYRTADGGQSWQHVYSGGYAQTGDFRPSNGKTYVGGVFSLLESSDGIAWKSTPGAPGTDLITGTPDKMFVARGESYSWANVSDLSKWTALPKPAFPYPDYVLTWGLVYDPDHHILYSVNSRNGFWRIVVAP